MKAPNGSEGAASSMDPPPPPPPYTAPERDNGGEPISGNTTSHIKTSLSMTSLPPDEHHQQANEVIKAKLRVERPYNSLKKKRNSERDSWRHSWGSGHSHSSCSLHSNATGIIGVGLGKDEFWAALQTNYNYIMDTNLLDTCKEARCEIEGAASVMANQTDCCFKMLESSRDEYAAKNPKELRKWLREMDSKISKFVPSKGTRQMSIGELQSHVADYSVLYCEIASHARVVGACIKASEKEQSSEQNNSSLSSTDDKLGGKTPSPNGKKCEGNLKGLQDRYHLLYLRAYEIQVVLEDLLKEKSSSTALNDDQLYFDDTDDEPVSKVARLSDCESSIHDSYDVLDCGKDISDDNDSKTDDNDSKDDGDDEEDEDDDLQTSSNTWPNLTTENLNKFSSIPATDFDADSEGSDIEIVKRRKNDKYSAYRLCKTVKNDLIVLSENMDSIPISKVVVVGNDRPLLGDISAQVFDNHRSPKSVGGTLSIVTPGSGGSSGVRKRPRNVDASKFNRSNRKSKNCAIFYFKHLDTDNETNFGALSSHGSDILKSVDPSSDDDEGWTYSNTDGIDGIEPLNSSNNDSDKENKGIEKSPIAIGNLSSSLNSSETRINSTVYTSSGNSTTSGMNIMHHSVVEMSMNNDNGCDANGNQTNGFPSSKSLSNGYLNGNAHDNSPRHSCDGEPQMPGNNNNPSPKVALSTLAFELSPPQEMSHESIKQLVLEAEHLVRDESLKTPTKKYPTVKISTSVKKREMNATEPHIQKVQEWLEHQPLPDKDSLVPPSIPTTDCEASGEASESDSVTRMSDGNTSEGFTDSIATCMQGSTSNGNSTELIGGSTDPIHNDGSNLSLNTGSKVVRRQIRRKSDRPWSVSCLSQLTTSAGHPEKCASDQAAGLASHSISESALDSLSPVHGRKETVQTPVKTYDSRGSLKRRKTRKKKQTGKKSDSGSDGIMGYDWPKITQTLLNGDATHNQHIIEDLTKTLSMLNLPKLKKLQDISSSEQNSEEEQKLRKPNFRVGSYTTAYMSNAAKLGSLAALASCIHDDEQGGEYNTGTEDHNSSISETAWDNYQEKYNSENYSEGFDSDAARRLMEFGDDYRNFLDSQSDCCSSLSAANNLDSLSPPRMDSLQQSETKIISQEAITSSVDHARRRRALELEYERRRKTMEMRRKSSQDDSVNMRSPSTSVSSANAATPRNIEKPPNRPTAVDSASRKLDFGLNNSTHSLRRTSESDNSTRRRKFDDRRRSSRTLEKSFKVIPGTNSSSNDDSDEEKELRNLLQQSRIRLDDTKALKIRSHLLRPEDYAEIISTCRDNIRCLDAVLKGPPGALLSANTVTNAKDLLSSWEDLLGWSENAGTARKMQEEMVTLKHTLNRLGGKSPCELDSESTIQIAIEELKSEKTELQTFRTNMLRLNASVHSWLTRQEMKLQKELQEQEEATGKLLSDGSSEGNTETTATVSVGVTTMEEKSLQINTVVHSECEFHKHLKDEVSEMYSAWDEADARINNQLEVLTASLIAWRQLECGLSEFHQVLGKDRGTLKGLEGALDKGDTTTVELANNVKLVAKLLSEKVDISQQQLAAVQEQLDPNRILHIAQFTSSNGSLSDSGISDGGTTSDGGLSERERRLGVLRRLAKQLESALAPGSDAMKSIAARMESAEAELKTLQNTCRELIVRTATSQTTKPQNGVLTNAQRLNKSPQSKRKNKRNNNVVAISSAHTNGGVTYKTAPDSGDPDDPKDEPLDLKSDDDDGKLKNGGWAWKRIAKIAFPMQVALLTILCAACLIQPNCCDNMNNFSMSFTPQLRYIRGPPPI